MDIQPINFDASDVIELLNLHVAEARKDNCSHAYDVNSLRSPDITMFDIRDEAGALMGFAALKALSSHEGEIKSVRTHPDHVRKGVSHALMRHIEELARARGYTRLLLETHPTEQYNAARTLYERRGYTYRGSFGTYTDRSKSVFMELVL